MNCPTANSTVLPASARISPPGHSSNTSKALLTFDSYLFLLASFVCFSPFADAAAEVEELSLGSLSIFTPEYTPVPWNLSVAPTA